MKWKNSCSCFPIYLLSKMISDGFSLNKHQNHFWQKDKKVVLKNIKRSFCCYYRICTQNSSRFAKYSYQVLYNVQSIDNIKTNLDIACTVFGFFNHGPPSFDRFGVEQIKCIATLHHGKCGFLSFFGWFGYLAQVCDHITWRIYILRKESWNYKCYTIVFCFFLWF